jgi:formylglycine-generating enzyme required for sulfatase activity
MCTDRSIVALIPALLAIAACSGSEDSATACDDGPTDAAVVEGFVLIDVEPGFTMGSPVDELGRRDHEPQHEVTLTWKFLIQTREVTQAEWKERMGNNPSVFPECGDSCPVENVTWWDALAYANAVSVAAALPECYRMTGCSGAAGEGLDCTGVEVTACGGEPYHCTGYRLPTEAEWEYAYRAGTTTAFYNGPITDIGCADPNLDAIGWYCGNATASPQPVGQKPPNPWGLYDMSGNVWEWCWDWFGDYPSGAVTDPLGPDTGEHRTYRGGAWGIDAKRARAAQRGYHIPAYSAAYVGLRLARSVP